MVTHQASKRYRIPWLPLLSLFAAAVVLLPDMARLPCMIDESMGIQASTHFFSTGEYTLDLSHPIHPLRDHPPGPQWVREMHRYTDGPFTPGMSVGIVSNWLSGIGWNIGGSVLWARAGSILNSLLLIALLAWALASGKVVDSLGEALAFVSLAFALTLLVVPWTSEGINYSMGEFSGFALLAIGMLVGLSSPFWGALLLGVTVWHTKFIYVPFAGIGLIYLAWNSAARARRTSAPDRVALLQAIGLQLLSLTALFMAPLFVWLAWIVIRSGWVEAGQWIQGRLAFIVFGNSGLDTGPAVIGLSERLKHPSLDWAGYIPKTKLRVLLLFFVPPLALLASFRARRNPQRVFASLALAALLLLFAAWYFLWHKNMWLRHIQPALFVGWGVLVFLFLEGMRVLDSQRRLRLLLVLSLALAGWQAPKAGQISEAFASHESRYAFRCKPDEPWTKGPMDLPQCGC